MNTQTIHINHHRELLKRTSYIIVIINLWKDYFLVYFIWGCGGYNSTYMYLMTLRRYAKMRLAVYMYVLKGEVWKQMGEGNDPPMSRNMSGGDSKSGGVERAEVPSRIPLTLSPGESERQSRMS